MTRVSSPRGRGAVLLAMLAVLGLTTVYVVATASADGRALTGDYCTTPTGGTRCMQITWDGVAYGTNNRDDLTLRPGEYWLTVNDTGTFGPVHNFALRSCPGSTSDCDQASGGDVEMLTTIADVKTVTMKVHLKAGTYRLFCAAGGTGPFSHETAGMYVAFQVGGVGQVDS
jgi:hypothetical protein